VFQVAVLDAESGEEIESRFGATREALAVWEREWHGNLAVVAIEATCGWRWVARELQAAGHDVRLAEPAQALALKGKKRRAKTDRLDAAKTRVRPKPRPLSGPSQQQPNNRPRLLLDHRSVNTISLQIEQITQISS
jgi:transposase